MGNGLESLKRKILAGHRYRLSASATVSAPSEQHPALLSLRFLDAQGVDLNMAPKPFLPSKMFGFYGYIGRPGQSGTARGSFEFTAPDDAAEIEVELHRWKAGKVEPLAPIALEPGDERTIEAEADLTMAGDVLGEIHAEVEPGESYDITARLQMQKALPAKSAVVTFRFTDEAGQRIDAPEWIPFSGKIGPYSYLKPVTGVQGAGPGRTGLANVIIPAGARFLRARLMRWRDLPDCSGGTLDIVRAHEEEAAAIAGRAALPESGGWMVLRGRLRATAGTATYMGQLVLKFHDASGAPVLQTAEGLNPHPLALNQIQLALPEGPWRRADGQIDVVAAFRPPPEAVRVSWQLFAEPGGWDFSEANAFAVQELGTDGFDPDILLQALPTGSRPAGGAGETAISDLRQALPAAPFWTAIGTGQLRVLGEWYAPQAAGDWLRLHATLTGPAAAPDLPLRLVPQYFDADMNPVEAGMPLGCRSEDQKIGPHRQPLLKESASGGVTFDEDLLAPEDAVWLACYLLGPAEPVDVSVDNLESLPISCDAAGETADPTAMTQTQLHCLAEIADAVWNPVLRRDANAALAILDPDTRTYAGRANSLREQSADLNTEWLPHLPPRPEYEPDPAAILHLLKVIYPDESSGGAVRSASILEAQAAQGLRPVACMPLISPSVELEEADPPVPDGVVSRTRNGVRVDYLHFPGLQPRQIPPADLLEFETRQHEHSARFARCSLVHAASGFRGYEIALKGLAIARAHDLPFVYEVRSFHEHTWRPVSATGFGDKLTRMRMAQENRCMAAADAVVTISEAMVENLAARGVPRDRLFFVPNAISGEFTNPRDPAAVAALRQRLGVGGRTTVGYISNFSGREGHAVLLAAFAKLVAEGLDLMLVLPGDGPERANIEQEAQRLGLLDRIILPGNVDHAEIKTWYGAIDLFVVPRIEDFASDYVTPLKPYEAMSQGVPVLMSDRPVALEIAGADGARAGLFPTGDSAALAQLIRDRLGDRDALAGQAELARQWVLTERVWDRVARRFDTIYETARANHAARPGQEAG